MAPNLAIKSESWLDLSTRGELIEACKFHHSAWHQFERGVSVEPSCLETSQARRYSSPSEATNSPPAAGKHNQHLLIRLRQHAYLARSNSTTLSSSNLSASIDLEPEALESRILRANQRDHDDDKDEDHAADGGAQPERRQRSELSFGLRSFRARFEQRCARAAAAAGRCHSPAAAATGEDNQRPQKRDAASPFARSWSSLSQHLESRLAHLGHSCKSLLYKYQRQRCRATTNCREQDLRCEFNKSKQQIPASRVENNQSLFSVKRRLTSDWVARHCATRADLATQPQHLAATRAIDRGRAASERPRSVQIETDWRDLESRRRLAAGERNEEAARQAPVEEIGFQRASSEFCHRAQPAAARRGESRTSSSTTLVSESEKVNGKKKKKKRKNQIRKRKSARQRDNNQQVEIISNLSAEESSSPCTTTTSTMSSGGQQGGSQINKTHQLMPPPPQPAAATSDYWSGGATSATASEFELLSASGGRAMAQSAGERLVGAPALNQLPLDADQDYYLDVAASMAATGSMLGQAASPVAHHLPDMSQQQQKLLSHNHQFQQQQQQQQQQLQQHEQMMFAAELEADYDDYAVPSDENGCRLDRSQVELVRLIGEGQKGFVFLGKLQSCDGSSLIDVAIKTLKYETEQLIERLMAEAATMKQLEHPHIIKFIGMCPETPALIAMELALLGELKHYLKINRHLIKCSQLVLFTFQISTALSYLESKNYVHRDVAARNVLVCSHNCVKLADFGLSRNLQNLHAPQPGSRAPQYTVGANNLLLAPRDHVDTNDQSLYVAAPRGKLPVRWLAPESLVFRRFTSASDVWMFAVCTWEVFHFGQVRPWPELRNQQVLLAIESGQRPQRPPACPERLYALMLKCWSYAPVQRPKFREIKQCIWSIYLNERTREQVEFERLEQVRQKYLLMARQQQQHQQQQQQQQVAMIQLKNHINQQQMLMSYSTPSNYSSAATTDNEQSTSPCSSAFNSMGRGGSRLAPQQSHQLQVQPPDAPLHQNQQALQSQLSRFRQRQQVATPADFRPHVLQKQRSQGAIGISTTTTTTETARQKQQEAEERDKSCCRHSVAAGRRRLMRAHDDQAIELAKRRSSTTTAAHQLHGPALFESDDDDEDDEDDEEGQEDGNEEEDSAFGYPKMFAGEGGRAGRQLPFAGGAVARVMSASPALTADGGRSQSRMVSLEPAYEGLFAHNRVRPAGVHAPSTNRPASRSGNQVAMLRANFDLGGDVDSSRGSPIFTNATTSPALTTNNSNPPTRPVSWRNSSELHTAASNHQRPPTANYKQPDQLGQMLQALRITPMKAKLKQPPEQSVRVLQRDSGASPTRPAAHRRLEANQKQVPPTAVRDEPNQPEADEHTRQLMVHQRLLGRIRPSSTVSDPQARSHRVDSSAKPPHQQHQQQHHHQQNAACESATSRTKQLSHQKSVEAVDHSLQILESLMSGGVASAHRRQTKISTLPRKRNAS